MLVLAASGFAQDRNKLPDDVATALKKAGELEVYSLNGDTEEKDGWHGSKVLGKTTVKKGDATKLAETIAKGVTEGDKGARCFVPRHGVRAVHGGKTYDLVICFECGWVYVFVDGSDKPTRLMISETPHKMLDKILTDAKVLPAKSDK
ncbi:MAG: hypothetical protein J0H63_09890 [Rhizobiales bacterium]|nr:hypothetical protein [Hyphomicrobiales bacterium]